MLNPLALPFAAALIASPASLPVADIYVDLSVANCAAGTGTASDPVCSITSAIALSSAGDTIRIAPGTYVENLTIGVDVELVGTGGEAVTIVDGSGSASVVTISPAASVTIEGLTMRNGLGLPNGGGLNVEGDANLVMRNSTITANATSGLGPTVGGGGIGANGQGAYVLIEGCTVTDNFCDANGGGVAIFGGELVIRDSLIQGNSTYPIFQAGGGVRAVDSHVVILNSTLTANSSYFASALTLENSTIGSRLSHVTVTGHVDNATNFTSAVSASGTVQVELHNSVIAGNNLTNLAGDAEGMFVSLGHNLIGQGVAGVTSGVNGDLAGTVAAPLDAMLAPLADNGGSTLTHALLPGSPAIDAGDPLAFEPSDQRGYDRPEGLGPDMGALESGASTISVCDGDGGDQAGCTDCPCSNNAAVGTHGGCLNSVGASGRLAVEGSASVSLPAMSTADLRFELAGISAGAFTVLMSGDGVAPTDMANPCFGLRAGSLSAGQDGLTCAVLNTRTHGGRAADSNGSVGATSSPWGGEGNPPLGIAQAFGGFSSGQTRYFQAIYRENPLAMCMNGLNSSQAVVVVFTP